MWHKKQPPGCASILIQNPASATRENEDGAKHRPRSFLDPRTNIRRGAECLPCVPPNPARCFRRPGLRPITPTRPLRAQNPPRPYRALRGLPLLLFRRTHGRPPPRLPRCPSPRRTIRPRCRPRSTRAKPPPQCADLQGREPQNAAHRQAPGEGHRRLQKMDRRRRGRPQNHPAGGDHKQQNQRRRPRHSHRRRPQMVGLPTPDPAPRAPDLQPRLDRAQDRQLYPRQARREQPPTLTPRRPPHADPPRLF